MIDKNITFLVSLPRSGNTLLGSLLNQNPEVAVTANSITLDIFKEVFLLKETEGFLNFPDHTSIDNVLRSILPSYYKDWSQKYILDRSPAGTIGNSMVLNKYLDQPLKAVLLVRNLEDIFASFLKVLAKTETLTEERCDAYLGNLMGKDAMIARALDSIQYFTQPENKHRCIIVKYDNLVKNPIKEINRIHQFVGIPKFNYNIKNFSQFSVNGTSYNDQILGHELHTINTNGIHKVKNEYKKMIPKRILDKYGHIRF
jgi:sulfotransferase